MTIPRNLSFLAEGASSTGVLGVTFGGTGLTSLTQGYIPFGSGTSAFGSSSNLFWDSTNNRLGIGFSSPTAQIEIAGYPNATLKIGDGGGGTYTLSRQASTGYFHNADNNGGFGFIWSSGSTTRMQLDSSAGNLTLTGTVKTGGYLVASLPTGVTGATAYVTNALSPTFGATVVGGGAVTVPVFYNGSNWIVG